MPTGRQRGRPKNANPTIRISYKAEEKLCLYLDDLIAKQEGYGSDRGAVTRYLAWEQIKALQAKGLLKSRNGADESGARG